MELIEEVIAEIRNDALRDCVYNHDDLNALANRLERMFEVAPRRRYALGDTVRLCGDKDFRAVIMSVEETVDGTINYHLVWRDQRGFCDKRMDEAELKALEGLKEA